MSIESNKAFVKRHFEEFVNQKRLEVADVNFADDFKDHGTDTPDAYRSGKEGPKAYLAGAFKRFPDIHVTINDIIAEGDKVMVRNTWQGTDFTSHEKIEFSGIVIWRIAQGKLAERWAYLEAPRRAN